MYETGLWRICTSENAGTHTVQEEQTLHPGLLNFMNFILVISTDVYVGLLATAWFCTQISCQQHLLQRRHEEESSMDLHATVLDSLKPGNYQLANS